MVDSDTSECQYSLFSSKDRLYAGTNDENELTNYVYNEPFYTPVFSHRNTAFNTEINKFNTYKSVSETAPRALNISESLI